MLKKIITAVCLTALCGTATALADGKVYDASVFGGNAEYLLEDHFADTFSVIRGDIANRHPSGWDIDYRGGQITTENYILKLKDTSSAEKISMSHDILPIKNGEFTFETALCFDTARGVNFSAELGGGDGSVIKLNFDNGNIYAVARNGSKKQIAEFSANEKICVKADVSLDKKQAELVINNKTISLDIPSGVGEMSRVSFCTGNAEVYGVKIYFANLYINYILNERFAVTPENNIPDGFTLSAEGTASGVTYAPGAAYRDDQNGFSLKNTADIPEIALKKSFENDNTETTVSWTMLLPEKQNGVSVSLLSGNKEAISVKTLNGGIYAGNEMLKSDYNANFWYNFCLKINRTTKTYDVLINYKTVKSAIPYSGDVIDGISFKKTASGIGELLIDDVKVYKSFEKYADYPGTPQKADSADVNAGMVMYPMWREGIHFGWDTISPYADERKPLLGYYTEGQREVSDWQNKWMAEHGIDYAIYPFVRPASDTAEPVKMPVRGEDLNCGYMNSEYSDYLNFAILLSAFSTENYHGAEDFIENVIPYISEYYFSDPRYMKINNKLPVFCYSFVQMSRTLGGAAETAKVINALEEAAKKLGYDGMIFGADAASAAGHALTEQINSSSVYIWQYSMQSGNVNYLKARTDEEYRYSSRYIASVPMGYDDTPWRASYSRMLLPNQAEDFCGYVKQHSGFSSSAEKMVVFTCWNEYGEGHYFAPSTKGGFGYLNAIRNTFTANGKKTDEDTPSDMALARMGAFYPNGRGALKTLPDKQFTDADIARRNVLYRYDFDADNADNWNKHDCTAEINNGCMEGTAYSSNVYLECFDLNTGVEISKVEAVKLRIYEKGKHNIHFYYVTEGKQTVSDYGEFFNTSQIDGNDEYSDYILRFNSGKTVPEQSGKITGVRLRFESDAENPEFGVDYFELLGDNAVTPLYDLEFDESVSAANCTVKSVNGALECTATAADPQIYVKADTGADISKVKAIKIRAYTQGSNELTVYYTTTDNTAYGADKKFVTTQMSGTGSYADYILYPSDLGDNPIPSGEIVSLRIDPADNIIESGGKFGIDRIEFYDDSINSTGKIEYKPLYRQEFTSALNRGSTPNCTTQLIDGKLECTATGNDPQLYIDVNTGIDISEITNVRICAYTKNSNELTLFYKTTDNPSYGAGKKFVTTKMSGSEEYAEYILEPSDLGTNPVPTGTVTGIRIDPADNIISQGGKFGISYIELCSKYDTAKRIRITIDGKEVQTTADPIQKDGTIFIPVYSILLKELNAYPVWNEPSKTLTVQMNGYTASMTAQSNEVQTDDGQVTWEQPPFYKDGNLFVPYKEFFEAIGYLAQYDEKTREISCSKQQKQIFEAAGMAKQYGGNIVAEIRDENIGDFVFNNMPSELNFTDNALHLEPNTGSSSALFGVKYVRFKGERRPLKDIIKMGGKMRVSFSYKGENAAVQIENRGSGRIDKTVKAADAVKDEWHTVSCEFDNSAVTVDETEQRWLVMRITPTNGSGAYLDVSDFCISVEEEEESTVYDDEIKFRITAPTQQQESIPYICLAAEYDKNNCLVSTKNIVTGNTGNAEEYIRYYSYTPQKGNTVKLFMWNKADMSPLCGYAELMYSGESND